MRLRRSWSGQVSTVLVAVAMLAGGACCVPQRQAAPLCRLPSEGADTLILMAQAVPTADRVPCVTSYQDGWHFASLEVRSGRSRFTLDNDRAGVSAMRVEMTPSCDTREYTEIGSDEPDTLRFERVLSVEGRFRAMRAYKFAGGCVTYRFQFDQRGQALVNEVSAMVTFVTRDAIDAAVRSTHRDGIGLDPPPAAR